MQKGNRQTLYLSDSYVSKLEKILKKQGLGLSHYVQNCIDRDTGAVDNKKWVMDKLKNLGGKL